MLHRPLEGTLNYESFTPAGNKAFCFSQAGTFQTLILLLILFLAVNREPVVIEDAGKAEGDEEAESENEESDDIETPAEERSEDEVLTDSLQETTLET